ncbi:hypothetical protein TRFO_09340 [Tritrichomonas foetus]|uniref:Uncharacterized protein n=1 Tax=Tritrichomonas foetus TaxID=1144522 RepID=A0A1J4JJA0_9EUKA|nr:hypothetical protein TRFO_09340 [Tritrichomonas foetus]|eukprot:OHS97635.1 hypothetical protein TRFO_09340 [Tritrichomonas foetus]
MITDDDIMKLRKNLKAITNPEKWHDEKIEQLILISYQYSQVLQDDAIYNGLSQCINEYIRPPEQAKEMPDFLLSFALANSKSRKTLALLIQLYVKHIPDGREKAKSIIANHIRSHSMKEIIISNTSPSFSPWIVSAQISAHKNVPQNISGKDLAHGGLIALARQPSLLPQIDKLIHKHFTELPVDDIVNAAVASTELMKFVLSNTVPIIAQGNVMGYEILQRLAASSNPGPAILVSNELKAKLGINCLL